MLCPPNIRKTIRRKAFNDNMNIFVVYNRNLTYHFRYSVSIVSDIVTKLLDLGN